MNAMAGYAAMQSTAQRRSAISPEAEDVRVKARGLLFWGERSQALFGPRAAAIADIWALVRECAEPDWDGSGAKPVSEIAAQVADDFVRALPEGVPMPEFAPEPDGSISLDWIQSRNRLLALSVSAGSRLAYAWLDGTEKGHAVASFDREAVPPSILDGIRRIMDGNAGVRPR